MLQIKKWLSGLTAGAVLLSGMAFSGVEGVLTEVVTGMTELTANAEENATSGTCGDNLNWTLEDGVLTISGTGEMEDFEEPYISDGAPWFYYVDYGMISSIIIEDGVTSIGDNAFSYCNLVSEVIIPESVTSIGYCAFYECESLASITIPDGVIDIGGYAFSGTAWLEAKRAEDPLVVVNTLLIDGRTCEGDVTISGDITTICDSAFSRDFDLDSIVIEDGVTKIGSEAFYCCGYLSSISIPESVTEIGYHAFMETEWLTERQEEDPLVVVNHILVDGTTCTGDITIPDEVTTIASYAFAYVRNEAYGADITSVVIPDSVTNIGPGAFMGCTILTSVTLPKSITAIEAMTFYGCYCLTEIEIPNGVTTIGSQAFGWCNNLNSVTIGNGVTSIGNYAFYGCESLTSITIPDSVTSIGDYAFGGCDSLTSIIVDDNNSAYCGVDGVLFDKNVKTLIYYPAGKTNRSYVIPDGVTRISYRAFYYCESLTSITIPDSVTSIGYCAFIGCDDLESVTIGSGVTSIGDRAFGDCESLTDVYYTGSKEEWNTIEIGNYNEYLTDATIHFATQSETPVATATTTTETENTATTITTTTTTTTTDTTVKTADLDADGEITISDAFLCLTAYANSAAENDDGLTDAQREAADVDGDGSITIMDASYILQFYAQTAAGNNPTWEEIISA